MRITEWHSDEKKIKVTGNLRPGERKTICSGSLKHRSYGEVKRGLIYFKTKQKKPTKQEQQQHKNKQTKQNTKAHRHKKRKQNKHKNQTHQKTKTGKIKLKNIKAENRNKTNKQS